ncbi:uncharacterized protein LOC120358643 [Solenopsis invicta]|uniref:uncharacterized protein LOC120358643 n=1 Tax=Solenopsis invicta TaxID=13686 RepID=UPI00193E4C77|nr:uncharacterized protein LOC120358643 [Solenopsis invicta]
MMSDSPKYQVVPVEQKNYQSVESAFMARTVVPPLSPLNSDANTTMASGMEKSQRKSAPILLSWSPYVRSCSISVLVPRKKVQFHDMLVSICCKTFLRIKKYNIFSVSLK